MINKTLKLLSVLVLAIGFMGVNAQAQNAVCPSAEHQVGFLILQNLQDDPADVLEDSDFTAGLLGTQEVVDGAVVGGMDWLYRDDSPDIFPTTQTGSQIVSWWTLKSGRSTYVHVTNTAEDDPTCDTDENSPTTGAGEATQYVHVEVLGEDCLEILNFCDVYTPEDSHIYDLDNIVTNAGQVIGSSALDGKEGTIVITSVSECAEAGPVFPLDSGHDFFAATTRVIDSIETDYGFNAYARSGDDESCDSSSASLDNLGPGMEPDDASNYVDTLEKDFNVVTESALGANDAVAGGDLILINFADDSDTETYKTIPGYTFYDSPVIFDYKEAGSSCPEFTACFLRTGIDLNLPADKEFVIAPPTEDCSTPGDEDGNGFADCEDSACDSDPSCENGDEECSDGEDNDADGSTDCADAGCAGATGPDGGTCEPAGETSCDDGADNDGDGDVDGDDSDCQAVGDDDDDDSGGCSLVANASAGTAAVNVLLPMMVFGLVFGLRRIRRRK